MIAYRLPCVFILLLNAVFSAAAQHTYAANQFATLASFPGGESAWPMGALAFDGNYLYGTTQGQYPGVGTVYRIAIDGSPLSTIHEFVYPNSAYNPYGGISLVGQRLFGVTYRGGAADYGTVFALDRDGTDFQLLKSFGPSQGTTSVRPHETVASDGTTLFGTTTGQAVTDFGSVFRIDVDGSGYQSLHSFNAVDGSYPVTRLSLIGSTLYGTTGEFSFGAINYGTIFSLNVDGSNFQTLHKFAASEGIHPSGDFAIFGEKLFGVAREGGTMGLGTIYSIGLDGSNFQTIHSFTDVNEGRLPLNGLTVLGERLYGTTVFGGIADAGTIFCIDADGTDFEVIHHFNGVNGMYPLSNLLHVGSTLYGTTERGGAYVEWGTVFGITVPEPSVAILLVLTGCGLSGTRLTNVNRRMDPGVVRKLF